MLRLEHARKNMVCAMKCGVAPSQPTYEHHSTHHRHHHLHHKNPSALSSSSPLSPPTFFIHTKENNRLPFDTKFFANLHDDRLRSKIGKIQLKIGKT